MMPCMKQPEHIIISRTDNIGDVILTLPLAALIKKQWPNCKISFLARDYVADVVKLCYDIDHFISWDQLQNSSNEDAIAQFADADWILHVFPNKDIAKLAKAAKIPHRVGTARRLYHWWTCNHRINFSRKNSPLHEAQLNLALLEPLRLSNLLSLDEMTRLTHLTNCDHVNNAILPFIETNKFNLVLHPLTNGNTKEWPIKKFAELIESLDQEQFNIILTGGKNEITKLTQLTQQFPNIKNAVGKLTLAEFINLLTHVNGVVVNSTGPLHIAAALGTNVLGLFPAEKGKDPGRWGPLGHNAQTLTAKTCMNCQKHKNDCQCMESISIDQVKSVIATWQ